MLFMFWANSHCAQQVVQINGPMKVQMSHQFPAGDYISYSISGNNLQAESAANQNCALSFGYLDNLTQFSRVEFIEKKDGVETIEQGKMLLDSTVIGSLLIKNQLYAVTYKGTLLVTTIDSEGLQITQYHSLKLNQTLSRVEMFEIWGGRLVIADRSGTLAFYDQSAKNVMTSDLLKTQIKKQVFGGFAAGTEYFYAATSSALYGCDLKQMKSYNCKKLVQFAEGDNIIQVKRRDLFSKEYLFILKERSGLHVLDNKGADLNFTIHGEFSSFEMGDMLVDGKMPVVLYQRQYDRAQFYNVNVAQVDSGRRDSLAPASIRTNVLFVQIMGSHLYVENITHNSLAYNGAYSTGQGPVYQMSQPSSTAMYIRRVDSKTNEVLKVSLNQVQLMRFTEHPPRLVCRFNYVTKLADLELRLCKKNKEPDCLTWQLEIEAFEAQPVGLVRLLKWLAGLVLLATMLLGAYCVVLRTGQQKLERLRTKIRNYKQNLLGSSVNQLNA